VRAVAAVYAFAAFFGLVGGVGLVLGVHDASVGVVTVSGTAGSALVIAVGVTLLTAAVQLVVLGRRTVREGERPPCSLVVMVACLLTLLVGVYVLLAALGRTSGQWPVVLLVGLVLIAVPLAGFRFFHGRNHATWPRVGVAVALTVLATVVGAWEFWFQNQYTPSQGGRAVALNVNLVKLPGAGTNGKLDLIHATVNYEDVGSKSVWVLGSVYTLTGSRVVTCALPASLDRLRSTFDFPLVDPQRIRYMADVYEERPATVLAAGKFVGDGKLLEPGVASSRDLVFEVPHTGYQLLRLRAELFAIPGSVELLQGDPPRFGYLPQDNELYALWQVGTGGWFHQLLYGRRQWLVVRYELVDPAKPSSSVVNPDMRVEARFPEPQWSDALPGNAAIASLFESFAPTTFNASQPERAETPPTPKDASEPFSDAEIALGPAVAPTSADAGKLPKACAASGSR
jgi:hypothetical protein